MSPPPSDPSTPHSHINRPFGAPLLLRRLGGDLVLGLRYLGGLPGDLVGGVVVGRHIAHDGWVGSQAEYLPQTGLVKPTLLLLSAQQIFRHRSKIPLPLLGGIPATDKPRNINLAPAFYTAVFRYLPKPPPPRGAIPKA